MGNSAAIYSLAAGQTETFDGPVYGFAVLSFSPGATFALNGGATVPVPSLLTLTQPRGGFDRLVMTGPCVVMLAFSPTDPLASTVAAPAAPAVLVRDELVIKLPAGVNARTSLGTGATTPKIVPTPSWARSMAAYALVGPGGGVAVGCALGVFPCNADGSLIWTDNFVTPDLGPTLGGYTLNSGPAGRFAVTGLLLAGGDALSVATPDLLWHKVGGVREWHAVHPGPLFPAYALQAWDGVPNWDVYLRLAWSA